MTKLLGADPDTAKAIRGARRQGWTVEITGKNRLRWVSPPDADGNVVRHVTALRLSGDTSRIKKIHKFLREGGVEL